jgi:flavin reductase (DIM6/NTAB) family NADH-FMN oxidoreductase RutF
MQRRTAAPVQDNSNVHRYFATTVGLITTDGKHGRNVMAAEWTMQISYEPMLIAIFIHDSPTLWNIRDTRAFGVNIASDGQAELVNIAGGYSGTELDKLGIPGTFETYRGKNVPMVKECALNAECKVHSIQEMGDHVMVVGEAEHATFDEKKSPLIYTRGNYRRLAGSKLASGRKVARLAPSAFDTFKQMSAGQFVLKGAAALVEMGGKMLVTKFGRSWMMPAVAVSRGDDYKAALSKHLASIGVRADVGEIVKIERLTLKSAGNKTLRANFVVYRCRAKGGEEGRWVATLPGNTVLRRLFEEP